MTVPFHVPEQREARHLRLAGALNPSFAIVVVPHRRAVHVVHPRLALEVESARQQFQGEVHFSLSPDDWRWPEVALLFGSVDIVEDLDGPDVVFVERQDAAVFHQEAAQADVVRGQDWLADPREQVAYHVIEALVGLRDESDQTLLLA